MKQFKSLLMLFVTILLLVSVSVPASSQQHQQGDKAMLFTFGGFGNLSAANFNGGVGFQYYWLNRTSFRGSLGFDITDSPNGNNPKNVNGSGALLFDFAGTNNTYAYVGPEFTFNHTEPQSQNSYSFGGVLGASFTPWQNISLGAEYKLAVVRDPSNNSTSFKLGDTTGKVILAIWL